MGTERFKCCRAPKSIYDFIKMPNSLDPSARSETDNVQFSMQGTQAGED